MDDIKAILNQWAENPLEDFALATIVRTTGSTYRKAGARMLIAPDGTTTGMVSGGCLEREVAEHGRSVLQHGRSTLLSFDTRRLLGCNGAIDLLVEPVYSPINMEGHFFATAWECLAQRRCLVASTLFEAESPLEAEEIELGTHPLIAESGRAFSTHGLPESARLEGGTLFHATRPVERCYTMGGGRASVLLHNVSPPIRLYVCGGGPDVVPVAALAAQLGWEVRVVTHPSQEAPELPPLCMHVAGTAQEVGAQLLPDSRTACVVMTHHYGRDLAWLSALLPLRLPYLGLLGPRKRFNELFNTLISETNLADGDMTALDTLHSPIGLDLGADGPEEIALSIVSEVKAVLSGRGGGFLRNRQGAIHAENEPGACTRVLT
ncbi:MAG TPA: XdhC family protein [Prosthecobacter sp.]